ncbi:MAG TPA: protein-disulfide reductase DsbD domain-containing protein [Puia sp.]|nr:protein-disulfide reductase DsbD domain-containing protein [Puia sp.]
MIQRLLLAGILQVYAFAPLPNPVQWTYFSKRLPDDRFEVYMVASIPQGWHIYSQANTSAPGPIQFKFFKHPGIRTKGMVKELNKPAVIKDQFFKTNVKGFLKKATFVQALDRKDSLADEIRGMVTFIACNDKDCLPPKTDSFRVDLK